MLVEFQDPMVAGVGNPEISPAVDGDGTRMIESPFSVPHDRAKCHTRAEKACHPIVVLIDDPKFAGGVESQIGRVVERPHKVFAVGSASEAKGGRDS